MTSQSACKRKSPPNPNLPKLPICVTACSTNLRKYRRSLELLSSDIFAIKVIIAWWVKKLCINGKRWQFSFRIITAFQCEGTLVHPLEFWFKGINGPSFAPSYLRSTLGYYTKKACILKYDLLRNTKDASVVSLSQWYIWIPALEVWAGSLVGYFNLLSSPLGILPGHSRYPLACPPNAKSLMHPVIRERI